MISMPFIKRVNFSNHKILSKMKKGPAKTILNIYVDTYSSYPIDSSYIIVICL